MKRIIISMLLLCLISPAAFADDDGEKVLRRKVAIGRFMNQSRYARGIFYDPESDPVAKQCLQLLSVKLTQSGKFLLLERSDMDVIAKELEETGKVAQKVAADYIIIGAVTEMNRRTDGRQGAFGNSKTQTAECRVSLKLIDVSTGQIIFADEGSGSAFSHKKTVMGMGGKANYDTTLDDKALSAALDGLVSNVVQKCLDNPWKAYILGEDTGRYIISGGASQGLAVGDIYTVMSKGRSVVNPQTGMTVELPGKPVGKLRIVELIDGQTPESEMSFAELVEGSVDPSAFADLYITDK